MTVLCERKIWKWIVKVEWLTVFLLKLLFRFTRCFYGWNFDEGLIEGLFVTDGSILGNKNIVQSDVEVKFQQLKWY